MKVSSLLIIAVLLMGYINNNAQKQFNNDCQKPDRVILQNGETFKNNCDLAYVLNSASARELFGILELKSAIIDSLEKQKSVLKTMSSQQDEEIKHWEKVKSIQDSSYRLLKKSQEETSTLVKNSLDNTNRALSYAKKIKYSSYITSFAVGGIAGGLIDNNKYSFGLGGALVGAASGVLINYLFQEIFIGD